jgi:hypothetical protein
MAEEVVDFNRGRACQSEESRLSIIVLLPLVLPHLLDVLVLVIVLRSSLFELLLLLIFGLLILVLHIVVFAVSLPKFL